MDKGNPDRFDGTGDDRVGDEPKGDDGDEGPGEDRLHDPSVAGRVQDGGRHPPSEDECGESKELQAADQAGVPSEPRELALVYPDVTLDVVDIGITTTGGNALLLVWKRGRGVGGDTTLLY